MDKVLHDIKGNTEAKGNIFYMDGKKSISIVISLNCI